jgi:hypothetical protein
LPAIYAPPPTAAARSSGRRRRNMTLSSHCGLGVRGRPSPTAGGRARPRGHHQLRYRGRDPGQGLARGVVDGGFGWHIHDQSPFAARRDGKRPPVQAGRQSQLPRLSGSPIGDGRRPVLSPQWVIQLPPPVVEAGPGHARRGQLTGESGCRR